MKSSRREFFKKSLEKSLGTGALLFAAPALVRAFWPSVARAEGQCAYVVPGQGMAASVKYTEDKKKVTKDLQIDRNGVKFANQSCSGCALYTKDAAGNFGKCALFPNQCVKATSWCASWNKKA